MVSKSCLQQLSLFLEMYHSFSCYYDFVNIKIATITEMFHKFKDNKKWKQVIFELTLSNLQTTFENIVTKGDKNLWKHVWQY